MKTRRKAEERKKEAQSKRTSAQDLFILITNSTLIKLREKKP